MKRLKIISFLLMILFTLSGFADCGRKAGSYTHPVFKTKYTQEEHIEKLNARTEERFAKELASGEIVDYEVEIVYAFYDNDPEYFLVTLEYKDEMQGKYRAEDGASTELIKFSTRYKHLIGYIENDVYRTGLMPYQDFEYGRSPYHVCGYNKAKKYYGGFFYAVETEEGILQIYGNYNYGSVIEFDVIETSWKTVLIGKRRAKELMQNNNKVMPKNY